MGATAAEKGIPSRPLPQPNANHSPKNQPFPGPRWSENNKDPTGVYRFIDAEGRGWESPAFNQPFKQTDWHKPLPWWFDGREKKWVQGRMPPKGYRVALPDERDLSKERDLHGYADTGDVPVYVKIQYRLRKGTETTGGRSPGLRALDRTARVLIQGIPESGTPHLATATSGGALLVAGNTGKRSVSAASQTEADATLAAALDPSSKSPSNRRAAKDARKLRALQSGDYRAHHERHDRDLKAVSEALKQPARWSNVDASSGSAEHGEMTVLGRVDLELQANPNPRGQPIVKALGGVKLACGACALAFEAYNQFIASRLGYVIKVSGTHGGFFNGWRVPDVIWNDKQALRHVRDGLPVGARLDKNGVLYGVPDSGASYHDPDESDSEWEEL